MKAVIHSLVPFVALLAPAALLAQDSIPRDLAKVEIARSKACVGTLARLAQLDSALTPYAQRVDRLNALGMAVSLEKPGDAVPFDLSDSLEAAVAQWFTSDSILATRYITQPDSAIAKERSDERNAMLDRLRQAIQSVSDEAQGNLGDGAAIEAEAQPCAGAVLVRSAVLEACAATPSPVCEAARAQDPQGPYTFVDDAADLWDLEEYGPWSTPGPLQMGPEGNLTGASTSARARRGNAGFVLALRPLLSERSGLSDEEIAQYQAIMDSLGFTFDHPDFVMAPGLEIQGNLPPPLGGETHYVLHFGDLSGDDDVIWSMPAGAGGPFQAVFPAAPSVLTRLQAGELVSLSALRIPEAEDGTPEGVFTLSLLQVGETANVGALVEYMGQGGLSQDLRALFPPGSLGR